MASTQLLFFIPVFYTLSRWLQLFYPPWTAVWVVTQSMLVSPTGVSQFFSTALKLQLSVQPICVDSPPVVLLNTFLCKITVLWKTCMLKYPHDNIYVQTHV